MEVAGTLWTWERGGRWKSMHCHILGGSTESGPEIIMEHSSVALGVCVAATERKFGKAKNAQTQKIPIPTKWKFKKIMWRDTKPDGERGLGAEQ